MRFYFFIKLFLHTFFFFLPKTDFLATRPPFLESLITHKPFIFWSYISYDKLINELYFTCYLGQMFVSDVSDFYISPANVKPSCFIANGEEVLQNEKPVLSVLKPGRLLNVNYARQNGCLYTFLSISDSSEKKVTFFHFFTFNSSATFFFKPAFFIASLFWADNS